MYYFFEEITNLVKLIHANYSFSNRQVSLNFFSVVEWVKSSFYQETTQETLFC